MTPGGVGLWTERYEALRAYATGQAPLGVIPLGLALLQHRGLVAWMTAASSSDDAAGREAIRPRDCPGDALDPRRRDLVRLLTGLAVPLAMRSAP